jgi:lysozyme family protein
VSGRRQWCHFKKDGYERSWANLKIKPARADEIRKEANRLLKGKSSYQQIEMKTGVPWWFVGLCHYREGSGRRGL